MTDSERRLLVDKCGTLLQDVLVEVRALSAVEGYAKQINDLADLTHNVPLFMVGRGDFVIRYLRAGFVAYARKYQPDIAPEQSRYVMLLDMDEATFTAAHRQVGWTWPEPELAPAAG